MRKSKPKKESSKVETGIDRRGAPGEPKRGNSDTERPWLVKHYFKKGDPRINRKGTPKPFSHIHKLAQSIGEEEVEITVGEGTGKQTLVMTRTELILLDWAVSTNPTKQELFIAYAHGRVPNVNHNANMTMLLRQFADRLTDAELQRVKDGESVVDILFAKIPPLEPGDDDATG